MAAPFVWGSGGRQLTPDQVEAEKKVANALMMKGMDYSPVQHWSQGAARVAQALMGGLDYSLADAAGKKNTAADKELLSTLLAGGAAPSPTAPSASPAPASAPPAPAMTSNKVYDNNEPSPLDPPSGVDRDLLARTVLAEAGNQGPTGMQAVANVVRNRAAAGNFGGDTVPGVVQKPFQFEPHNTADGRARMAAIDPNSPQYQNATAAIERAYTGDDPTRGATHFYAPKAQAALGRPVPAWAQGQPAQDIGDHRFLGGAGAPPVMAGASPSDVSAQAVRPQPVAQAPAGPNSAAIIGALTNPAASDATKKVATMLLQQRMQGDSIQTVDLGNAIGIMDKRGNLVKQIPKGQKPGDAPTVQRIKQADGSEVAVQWDDATGEWKPLKAPEGGNPVANPKLTEQQSKDVGFFNRGQKLLPRLEQQDKALTDFASATGGQVSNYFKTDSYRQAEQTGRELLAVILRKDTGAAVTPSEMSLYSNIYMPQPGDDMPTIQQKRIARQTAIEGLRMGLGPAEIIFRSREAAEAAKAPAAAEQGWTDMGGGVRIREKR
jgi:spore germination cell wall hydrolase CwlJ-like protein